MLSETYFTRRFNQVFSDPTVLDSILKQNVAISRMKLHYGNGIDGLTNTFASALWAADFIFQWMTMSGYQIYFDTDVTGGSFQSPFTSNNNLGGSPALVVWPIYYAMLIQPFMLPPVGSDNYMLPTTNLYKGPYNIKVYAYRQPDTEYAGAVIINKDTNSTLTG